MHIIIYTMVPYCLVEYLHTVCKVCVYDIYLRKVCIYSVPKATRKYKTKDVVMHIAQESMVITLCLDRNIYILILLPSL